MTASAGGGPDAALVVSILAALFAGLAVVFAGWSAWASHRSAGSADGSARSAAEAVELERDRRHRELRPRIELEHEWWHEVADEEGVWFTNGGPLDYTSVSFRFAQAAVDSPIAGFVLGTHGDIGPLTVGERTFLGLERHSEAKGDEGGTLYLVLTCRNGQGTWTIPAQVEIPWISAG
jgi:hypothetical protein